ncbi:hypothetical protein G5V59_03450 [Nocardioides sp. W3-2-3]|nr:hypothetical protein [Nocardioides convexus]
MLVGVHALGAGHDERGAAVAVRLQVQDAGLHRHRLPGGRAEGQRHRLQEGRVHLSRSRERTRHRHGPLLGSRDTDLSGLVR